MNEKQFRFILIIITITISILLTGCNVFDNGKSSDDGKDYILSGYYWMAGDDTPITDTGSERASINPLNFNETKVFSALISLGQNGSFVTNYPERGMKTFYTVTATTNNSDPVYKISARTEYPNKEDIFDYYLEEYYLKDSDANGNWTTADEVVEWNGSAWVVDSTARETMELHYQDGSVRKEWIVTDGNVEKYAHFDINGSMSMPDETWSPTLNGTMNWSSKVYYYQKIEEWVDYWYRDSKEVFGVRYYTESDEGSGKYYKTSYSLERIVSTETTFDESVSNYLSLLFDQIFGTSYTQGNETETLSETVIRDEITTNNKKTTKVNSKVVPTFGETFKIEQYSEYDL